MNFIEYNTAVFFWELALPGSMTMVSCVVGVALFFLFLFLDDAFFAMETLSGIEAAFCFFGTGVSDT